jgi:threonine/homoserine/homoserine lactone efflux protein
MIEIAPGIELLPELRLFLAFAIAGLALNLVPGADMTFVIASAARGGARDGVAAALGIGAGALVHIVAAVVGLSALIASSQTAFTVLKWLGAAYLLYIAFGLLRGTSGGRHAAGEPQVPPSRGAIFRHGALVNILNPKVGIFFLAFLPQFVDPHAAFPALQILALGIWFDLVGTLVNALVALAAAHTASRLRHVQWLTTASKWFAATVLGVMALRLIADRR